MKILHLIQTLFKNGKEAFFGLGKKQKIAVIVGFLLISAGVIYFLFQRQNTPEVTYQTSKVSKGTLVTSISGTGSISSGNSTSITTAATGTVSKIYVSNGDQVKKGDKIAEITLDEYATKQRAEAWAKYTEALTAVKTAQKNKIQYDIAMWNARQAIFDAQDEIEDMNNGEENPKTKEDYTDSEKVVVNKTLEESQAAFAEAELKYKNADAEISKAKASVSAALEDYQELSPIITAPADGTVSNLALAEGVIIESSESNSGSSDSSDDSFTISSQKIGQIDNKDGQFQAKISLTEQDVISVQANQKVTLTLDAYEDKTFTGKVLAIDTAGSVSSGVTGYPVTILMDATDVNIYPNMSVTAEIITSIQTDVLLVPSTAITTSNAVSSVQVMKDGQSSTVEVEIGESNDSQTVILSGLSEGDEVITSSALLNNSAANNSESSAFSSTNSNRSSSSTRLEGGMGGGFPGGMP
jgi:multidrug efflux pump subunit AcrA (membrane-fusion protein)